MQWSSLEEVLKFAVRKEADAAAFYRMAGDRSTPGVKRTFEELAREEDGHKKKLEGFDPQAIGKIKLKETKGIGIAEWIEDVPFSSDMSYADLIRLAIKNEERAEQFYAGTASSVTDPSLRKLLLILAQEETRHKKRLERIYDDEVLTEF